MQRYLATLLFVVVCLAGCRKGETSPRKNANQEPTPALAPSQLLLPSQEKVLNLPSKSPYEIQRYLKANKDASLNEIWQFLGLEGKDDMSYPCGDYCHTEVKRLDIGEANRRLFLLKVSMELGEYYEYFFFENRKTNSNKKSEWRFLSSVDSSLQRYGPPAYKFVSTKDQYWFALTELWGRGSGFSRYGARWFAINEDSIKEVLAYPESELHTTWPPDLHFEYAASLVNPDALNLKQDVTVEFQLVYKIGKRFEIILFKKKLTASYVWDDEKHEYIFEATKSDFTEEEREATFVDDTLKNEEMLKYNLRELETIAARGSREKKEWLKAYLENAPDSAEKRILQNALNK